MGWDTCKLHSRVVERVKKIIQEKYHISPKALCINASHTHSAPALVEQHAIASKYFDADYTEFIVDQAVNVVGDAINGLMPVRLRYCEYMCTSVGINRRNAPSFKPLFKPNFKGAVDHTAQIVAVESIKDGKLIGVAVKYACHPVTVGPMGLGADYPGFMRSFIEKRHPGAIAIFLQGCAGDVRAQMVDNDITIFTAGRASDLSAKVKKGSPKFIGFSVEAAEQFGRDLGMAVEWALNKPGIDIIGSIEVGYDVIDLPLRRLQRSEYLEMSREPGRRGAWGRKFLSSIDRGEPIPTSWPYHIQVFRFGSGNSTAPFVLVALQGEPSTEYGFNVRKMLQPANTIVIGYSNNMVTYVPTAQQVREGGYEPNAYKYGNLLPGGYNTAAESMILEAAFNLARPKAAEHK
jgi:hypothetical protein